MNLDVNINIIQYIAIIDSTVFTFFILELIRKKTLQEAYSLLCLFFAFVFLGLFIWHKGLDVISGLIGISYPPEPSLRFGLPKDYTDKYGSLNIKVCLLKYLKNSCNSCNSWIRF